MVVNRRNPAVAGLFYPDDPVELAAEIAALLAEATTSSADEMALEARALIVPHAGYLYSGAVAASAYRCLRDRAVEISRVVLLGPAHRVYLQGMAVPSVDAFATPLGDVALDRSSILRLLRLPGVIEADQPHALEHSLEVQLPFLQTVLGDFSLVPVVVGDCPPALVAGVLEALWDGPETLFVVSSDLSHFLSYEMARKVDAETSRLILSCEAELTPEAACGARALNGLLAFAGKHQLRVRQLDLRNSGDIAGERSRVVGYGSYALA